MATSNPQYENNETHISSLFTEILTIIFSHLSLSDKGRAAQVCTIWRDTIYCKSMWCNGNFPIKLDLDRTNATVFASLEKRGITRITVTSLGASSLRNLIHGIPTLQMLDLSQCTDNVTDQIITNTFVENVPSIRHLNLSQCTDVTNDSLARIAQYVRNLHVLQLDECDRLTNAGLMWIVAGLKRLSLRGCKGVTDRGIQYIARNNKALESLDLTNCSKLSDEALKYIGCDDGLVMLKSLNLTYCAYIGDDGLRFLAELTTLTDLNLSHCKQVSTIGIEYLAKTSSRITTLDLSHCDALDDQALIYLCEGLPNLINLSLNRCHLISDVGLKRIADSLFDLETLNLRRCNSISDKGLKIIAEKLKMNLKVIHLEYTIRQFITDGELKEINEKSSPLRVIVHELDFAYSGFNFALNKY